MFGLVFLIVLLLNDAIMAITAETAETACAAQRIGVAFR